MKHLIKDKLSVLRDIKNKLGSCLLWIFSFAYGSFVLNCFSVNALHTQTFKKLCTFNSLQYVDIHKEKYKFYKSFSLILQFFIINFTLSFNAVFPKISGHIKKKPHRIAPFAALYFGKQVIFS